MGGWKGEESKAVGMSYCDLGLGGWWGDRRRRKGTGGWVYAWVGGTYLEDGADGAWESEACTQTIGSEGEGVFVFFLPNL